MDDPIKELAKDLGEDPEKVRKWAEAEALPVTMSQSLLDAIAVAKEATIRAAAGAVCMLALMVGMPAHADDARLLDAIQAVETGGEKDPAHAVGDGGLALGWMQMHPDCYADCKAQDKTLPPYRECAMSRTESRRAVLAYWKKYGCKTDREKALCWHYGPGFRRVADRHHYYEKVKREMK